MSSITLTADMPIMLTSEFRRRIEQGEKLVRVQSMPLTVFVDAHERQSETNHRQTLARIRERGGFDSVEMVAVLSCLEYRKLDRLSEEAAHRILYALTSTHNRGMRVAEAAAAQTRRAESDDDKLIAAIEAEMPPPHGNWESGYDSAETARKIIALVRGDV